MQRQTLLLIAFLFSFALVPHAAEAKHRHHTAHTPARHHRVAHHHFAGVDSDAGYADVVIDAETGRVLHDSNPDSLRHPASLTKMMTLYLTFQAVESGRLGLGQYLPVSANASYQSPSKLGLHAGQRIRVEDAILGLVTESANDAAVVLGEALGGSEDGFADLMTRQAHALGMKSTQFRNPSGLPDPDQVTTAVDMATLGYALINHYPQFYPYFSHDSFTYAGIYHHTHNHLMDRYDGMDGIKTGYIRASGFNLVASAKRNGVRLIGVVFGGRSAVARDNHMAQLLDACFPLAVSERRGGRHEADNGGGQGDSDTGSESSDYMTLPAKVAAVFPARNAPPAPQEAARPVVQPVSLAQSAARPPVAKGHDWGVQIGAYSDASIGQQALASLAASMPQLLGGADAQVQQVSAGGVTMYRARLMALDKRTAQNVCSYLIQHGKSCLTVEP